MHIEIISPFRFIGSENPETYFTDTERTRVCYEILETAPYGRRQNGEIGRPDFGKVLFWSIITLVEMNT